VKTLLAIAFLLSISTLATASDIVSEEWTTYCDDGVEKLRGTIVFHFSQTSLGYEGAELTVYSDAECSSPIGSPCARGNYSGVATSLGNNDYRVVWQGWPRACIPSAGIFRDGFVVFRFPDYSGTFSYYSYMLCEDGERTVIDGGDCVPLPVTASTWGAVKALYR
jgi:hypothetical protein